MKQLIKIASPISLGVAMLSMSLSAQAVPVLQVGALAGPGDAGTYADYQDSTLPTEDDTAITSGSSILFAGVTSDLIQLGGQAAGGQDWGAVDSALNPFNGHGAIALLAVENGKLGDALGGGITLGGVSAFFGSSTLSGLFPNNHDPLKDAISDFLFFDIGNFVGTTLIPDFDNEDLGNKTGEIKALALGGTNLSLFNWIHFDVMALATQTQGGKKNVSIVTTWENNPGSHDVTWKNPCDTPDECEPNQVPEPNILALMGLGMLGMAMTVLRRRA